MLGPQIEDRRPPRVITQDGTLIRIANVITRMILGGPQLVSLLSAKHYANSLDFEYHLISGLEAGAEGDLFREVKAAGVGFHAIVPLRRELSLRDDPRALAALVQLFRRIRPHVVHARSAKARVLGPIAARLAGVPVVLQTVHGWSFNNAIGRRRSMFIGLERLSAALCDCSIFVSERDLAEGVELGIVKPEAITRGRAALIRSGIDLSHFRRLDAEARTDFRAGLGILDRQKVISLVQRLSPPKTPLIFVEAIRIVLGTHPDVAVWIVGDGPLRQAIESEVEVSGLKSHIRFLGLRTDIAAVLSATDVVVHSSLREGLPRVVVEALAVGTPVVATDVGGVSQVIRSGVNGLLVPPGDPVSLAQAILATLDDPTAAQRRAWSGLEGLQSFGAERMLEQQHELYVSLLARHGIHPSRS
jgi:glycosyltransferase involved in cell wall biosynthesis